eukprot:7836388-Heterocapsa_arctica.AAC.1
MREYARTNDLLPPQRAWLDRLTQTLRSVAKTDRAGSPALPTVGTRHEPPSDSPTIISGQSCPVFSALRPLAASQDPTPRGSREVSRERLRRDFLTLDPGSSGDETVAANFAHVLNPFSLD